MISASTTLYPLDLYRCLTCQQEGLAIADDRIYCPRCGQTYPVLVSRVIDFMASATDLFPLSPAQAIAHNPLFAWGYERFWRPWALTLLTGESFDIERETALLQDLVGSTTPILDLGTAAGYWSRLLLQANPKLPLIGLDNATGVLTEAAKQAQPQWIHYTLMRAPAERLPLATGSLGAVISGASLNELPLDQTLAEISRVLRPGGVLVSMHSQKVEGFGNSIQQLLSATGLHFLSESELRIKLANVGMQLTRYLSFGIIVFVQAVRIES